MPSIPADHFHTIAVVAALAVVGGILAFLVLRPGMVAARVAKLQVRAPSGGEVGILVAELGEANVPGQPVMTHHPTGHRWARFNLLEDQLDDLRIGSRVELTAPDRGGPIEAGVVEIAPRGEFATWRAARGVGDHDLNTFALLVDPVGSASEILRPGMSIWLESAGLRSICSRHPTLSKGS
jgi:hypothetical protein